MKFKNTFQFILFVLLPTMVAGIYYFSFASDQYVVKTSYIIQNSTGTTPDVIGALTGIPGGNSSEAKSAYIAQAYIESSTLLNELDNELNIRELYSNPQYDLWAKLKNDASSEEFLEYWQEHILFNYDTTSGIISMEVTAFKPEDAMNIAKALLEKTEQHVNNLSERARKDTLKFSHKELEKAEKKLIDARTEVTLFRNARNIIDPGKTSEGKIGIVTQLEGELSSAEAELNTLKTYMKPSSIKIRTLRNKINGLKKQIRTERKKWSGTQKGNRQAISSLIGDYEKLLAKKTLAERLYESALSSMEAARLNAMQQHQYLEVISRPNFPDEAEKPYSIKNTFTVFLASLMLWIISSLIISAIKDHV
jgi:capsular polysaccharide transport system permease protein